MKIQISINLSACTLEFPGNILLWNSEDSKKDSHNNFFKCKQTNKQKHYTLQASKNSINTKHLAFFYLKNNLNTKI